MEGTSAFLSNQDEGFSFACENGDIPTVQRLLNEGLVDDVDKVDHLGRTPIRLAVTSEHFEVFVVTVLD